jgi:hypothetical protein
MMAIQVTFHYWLRHLKCSIGSDVALSPFGSSAPFYSPLHAAHRASVSILFCSLESPHTHRSILPSRLLLSCSWFEYFVNPTRDHWGVRLRGWVRVDFSVSVTRGWFFDSCRSGSSRVMSTHSCCVQSQVVWDRLHWCFILPNGS